MKIICTEQVAPPGGHYSHAILHDRTVYVSGQLGRGPGMTDSEAGDIETQTRRCLGNISLWPTVNAVYAQILGSHRPARAVVPTRELHFGALIEIEAVAAVG